MGEGVSDCLDAAHRSRRNGYRVTWASHLPLFLRSCPSISPRSTFLAFSLLTRPIPPSFSPPPSRGGGENGGGITHHRFSTSDTRSNRPRCNWRVHYLVLSHRDNYSRGRFRVPHPPSWSPLPSSALKYDDVTVGLSFYEIFGFFQAHGRQPGRGAHRNIPSRIYMKHIAYALMRVLKRAAFVSRARYTRHFY